MAGHSKWANIKRRKGAQDAQKAKVFTKITRELIVAVRQGGPIPEENARLRLAIEHAKSANLPKEKIERAIKKGCGKDPTDNYFAMSYEGYAPHGVAVLIEALTDNHNRTVADVRALFNKHGGSLDKKGAIRHLFDYKSFFCIPKPEASSWDEVLLNLIEAGVDEIDEEGPFFYFTASPPNFNKVKEMLVVDKITIEESGTIYIPHIKVSLDQEKADQVMRLLHSLEDLDDVQQVYHNLVLEE